MFRQNQDMIRSNYICKSYDKSDKCEFEKQEINKEAKTGRLKLVKENSHFKTVPISDERKDYLQTVFKNGELIRKENFQDIKNRTLTYTRKR